MDAFKELKALRARERSARIEVGVSAGELRAFVRRA